MRVRVLAASVIAVGLGAVAAGCGGPPRASGQAQLYACPTADLIRYAEWRPPDAETDRPGQWAVRIASLDEGVGVMQLGVVDPTALALNSIETLPWDIWVLSASGSACRARIREYVAERVDDDAGAVTMVSALAEGCEPAGGVPGEGAWISIFRDEPLGCAVVGAEPVGRFVADESSGDFVIPAPPVPIPAPWADAVPAAGCEPACVPLWDIRATPSVPSVSEVVVTTLTPGASRDPCRWPRADFHGFFVVGADGVARPLTLPPPPSGDQPRPMTLRGALVDGGGARVALFLAPGQWAAWQLTDAGLAFGQHVRYYRASLARFEEPTLGPACQ